MDWPSDSRAWALLPAPCFCATPVIGSFTCRLRLKRAHIMSAALVHVTIALERIDSSIMMPRPRESNETDSPAVETFVTLRRRGVDVSEAEFATSLARTLLAVQP